jgi:NAD(P)H-dependent FMN reductase
MSCEVYQTHALPTWLNFLDTGARSLSTLYKGDGMPKLNVIIASTRPGRVGLPIGQWVFERVRQHGKFETQLLDLKEIDLPMFDEPNHPRLQKYEHAHTRTWSSMVSQGDAFVIVTPEYNYGSPPALVNALNYLYVEWNYKPVGFVSYGGQSGGMRSVQMTKQILGAMKMVPIVEAVHIPFFAQFMADGVFTGSESHERATVTMLDELLRWADTLKPLRSK